MISDIGIEHLGGMGVAAVPLSTLETVAEEEDDDSRHFGQLSSEERLLFSWDTGDTSAEDATLSKTTMLLPAPVVKLSILVGLLLYLL